MAEGTSTIEDGVAQINLEDDSDVEYVDDDGTKEHEPYLARLALTKENRNTLLEILKCAVCLEIPRFRQVKICEKGHHFCNYCHKKLKFCGICRGKLLNCRSFVVEEMITKLGKPLGLQRVPPIKQTPQLPPKGVYECPYDDCDKKMFALQLLPHFRAAHAQHFRDNLGSNPYTGWFQLSFSIVYSPDSRHVYSFHVSDIGLLTLIVVFPKEGSFRAWVQMARKSDGPDVKYRLSISNDALRRMWGAVDEPVLMYGEKCEMKAATEFPATILPDSGGNLSIHFLVTQLETSNIPQSWANLWNDQMIFTGKRSSRRTVSRNLRRKRIRAKYRNLEKLDDLFIATSTESFLQSEVDDLLQD